MFWGVTLKVLRRTMRKYKKIKQIRIFVDLNLIISDITNLKRVFEDTIDPTRTCSTEIKTNSYFHCIVFWTKSWIPIIQFWIKRMVIPLKLLFYNHRQNIWDKLWFSCKITHYGKSSICILQEFFPTIDNIFILGMTWALGYIIQRSFEIFLIFSNLLKSEVFSRLVTS